MKNNIGDLWKNNQAKPPKLSVRQKRNISWQTKCLREEMGTFFAEKVMVKASILLSISEETVRRVQKKKRIEMDSFLEGRNPDQKWPEIKT